MLQPLQGVLGSLGSLFRPLVRPLIGPLGRRRLDSALVILLVAIAVALSTTSFVVLEKVVLRPLPYPDADRVVHLWCVAEEWGIHEYAFSWPNYLDYREGARSFTAIAANRRRSFTVQLGDRPRSLQAASVTANFLEVLGLRPVLGRDFREGSTPGSVEREDVVLVGHRLWREELGADPDIVGRPLLLEGVPHTVLGVLPPELRYPSADTDLLVPLVPTGLEENRAFHYLRVIARLAPGVAPQEAGAEITAIAERLAADYPDATGALGARLVPLKEQLVGTSQRSLAGIWGAVQLLFLIACGNVAGVLLVSGVARQREIALRLALGATRRGVVRQLLGENLVLMTLGGGLGVALAWAAIAWLSRLDSTLLPRAYELSLDASTVGYAALVTVVAVVLAGGVPGWLSSRGGGLGDSGGGARGSTQARVVRAQRVLVVGQVAVTLLLLFGAAVLGRSVALLSRVDPGFDSDRALSAGIALPATDYPSSAAQLAFARRAIEELERLPGVEAVGALSREPFSPGNASITAFRPDQVGEDGLPNASYRVITPGFFASLGVEVVEGRDLRWEDGQRDAAPDAPEDTARTILVDERLAAVLWPDRSALGQRMRLGSLAGEWEVVGVVPSLRLRALDSEPDYTVYVAVDDNDFLVAFGTPRFIVRTAPGRDGVRDRDGLARGLVEPVHATLQAIDPSQAILEVRPLAGAIDEWLGNRRTVSGLVRVVAVLALVLAAVGLYATLSFLVGQRRGELAVRAALGAAPARLLSSSIGGGLLPAVLGVGLGVAGCWLLGQWLAAQLYGVGAAGSSGLGGTMLSTVGLLLAAALLSALPPSVRAAREDPARVLRRTL